MLNIATGNPHPDLEDALRKELIAWRERRDFSRLALVVPSDEMRRHLRRLIGREWGLSFLGLHLLTAHRFAQMILRDAGVRPPETAPPPVLQALVREVTRAGDFRRLGPIAETSGGPAALLMALRDLYEAGVPAEAGDKGDASEILRLYARFVKARQEGGLAVPADSTWRAARKAGGSTFVRGLSEVVYYGFYDMMGAQVELLRAVSELKPVTFLMPLADGPAFAFARRFLDEALKPLASRTETVERAKGPRPLLEPVLDRLFKPDETAVALSVDVPPRLITVSGTEAELEAAAREVLRLVEDEGLAFCEIAVIARALEPYVLHLERALSERRIPFCASAGVPASIFPETKAVFGLIRALESDLRRADLLDLFASPCFARGRFEVDETWPAYWVSLTRDLRVVGGADDWKKLGAVAEQGHGVIRRGEEDELRIDLDAAGALWACISSLADARTSILEEGTWEELTAAFVEALERHIDLRPDDADDGSARLREEIRGVVDGMARFGAVNGKTTREEFFAALRSGLEALTVPLGVRDADAVEVLDAMAARCRAFRAVVCIGLHEGSFPHRPHEDAFLGDDARQKLSREHGVRLAQKLAGFDEEKLLFHLVLAAARERVVLVRQRSDDEGKPLVPSWYLEELRRAAGEAAAWQEVAVPRRFEDWLRDRDSFEPRFLTPREWRDGLLVLGKGDAEAWKALSPDPALLSRALEASDELATLGKDLGPRDGITGKLEGFFRAKSERGFSPTSLQKYAECPFGFFAQRVLGLGPVEEPEEVHEVSPLDRGNSVHGILQLFFGRLVGAKYFEGEEIDWPPVLRDCAEKVFKGLEENHPTGWPLLWERTKAQILGLVEEYAAQELNALKESGFVPSEFEVQGEGCLPDRAAFPQAARGLKLYGFVDRVDKRAREGRVDARAVDYKFKMGGKGAPGKDALTRGAVRAQALQPPAYLLMARKRTKGGGEAQAQFHYLAPNWETGRRTVRDLPPDFWDSDAGEQTACALSLVVGGIEKGEWFALPGPGGSCKHCDFVSVCRKSHSPTRYRHTADPRPRELEQLAKTKLQKSAEAAGKRAGKKPTRKPRKKGKGK